MIGILIRTLIIALGIWVAAWLLPGISTEDSRSLAWAAISLGLINAFIRPLLVIMTLPVTVLTLGLFLLVLNAAMLNLAGWFVDGFEVVGAWNAIFGAIIISVISSLCSHLIGPNGRYELMIIRTR